MDIVELCKKYRHEGVVAIDLAGDESLNCEAYSEHKDAYEVSRKQTVTRTLVCALLHHASHACDNLPSNFNCWNDNLGQPHLSQLALDLFLFCERCDCRTEKADNVTTGEP